MLKLDMTADELISALLSLASSEPLCILDSCGARHLGSHLLIAGIRPVETFELSPDDANETLRLLDEKLTGDFAAIFTLSYEFGRKLQDIWSSKGIAVARPEPDSRREPDLFLSLFDILIIHDYDFGTTFLAGNTKKFGLVADALATNISNFKSEISNYVTKVTSNFTKTEYLAVIEEIKERIRSGDTYQTNLTQQLSAKLPGGLTPEVIFHRLRRDHPAPFAAFIKRGRSTVVSASPERFFCIDFEKRKITTSPIKGTRPRGRTKDKDDALKAGLLASEKDLAENTMIVDLLRNDLGRICEYGTVAVEKLCELEEHPSLFHLVSTVSGDLRMDIRFSEILKATFPCGSITGAPKLSTMRIIDELETADRGLSMGAIGVYVPSRMSGPQSRNPSSTLDFGHETWDMGLSLSVAIRTMVIRDRTATFNVGGGIVIDSDPESEYAETLTKAKALLAAIGANCQNRAR